MGHLREHLQWDVLEHIIRDMQALCKLGNLDVAVTLRITLLGSIWEPHSGSVSWDILFKVLHAYTLSLDLMFVWHSVTFSNMYSMVPN